MLRPSEHIPPSIVERNSLVEKFAKVIDGMQVSRDGELNTFEASFNPLLNRAFFKDFLYELGQLYILTDMPVFLIERSITQAYRLWGDKGSYAGLEQFAYVLCDGTIEGFRENWSWQKYLIPEDAVFGFLPDGEDLVTAANDPREYTFLFGDSFLAYYTGFEFTIRSNYTGSQETRYQLMRLIPHFIPMCDPETMSVKVTFVQNDGTFIETLTI